jgi:hypothetical protein
MAKQKKVTINHYLNKRLKPRVFEGKEYYTPYTRVTFDRNNTIFSMDWTKGFKEQISDPYENRFTEQEFDYFLQQKHRHVIAVNQMIEQAIRYESVLIGDKFELKGFGNRFELYRTPIHELMYKPLRKDLVRILSLLKWTATESVKIRRSLNEPSIGLELLKAKQKGHSKIEQRTIKPFYNDFVLYVILSNELLSPIIGNANSHLTVFDWITTGDREEIEKIFKSAYVQIGEEYSPTVINKIDSLIDKALAKVY